MILYMDTSALVKRYFRESGSEDIAGIWKRAVDIVISSVGYAEALASFYRKKREGAITDRQLSKVLEVFRSDWSSFIRIAAGDDLNGLMDRLVARYPLRGFDAIHLASALTVQRRITGDLLFCCFAQRLLSAAKKEGLEAFPFETV